MQVEFLLTTLWSLEQTLQDMIFCHSLLTPSNILFFSRATHRLISILIYLQLTRKSKCTQPEHTRLFSPCKFCFLHVNCGLKSSFQFQFRILVCGEETNSSMSSSLHSIQSALELNSKAFLTRQTLISFIQMEVEEKHASMTTGGMTFAMTMVDCHH